MGRHQTWVSSARRRDGPKWSDPYYVEWGVVVGDRIRRLRRDRDWTLFQLTERVRKPEGGYYSTGYFSRLERGWASAPLYVYIAIGSALEVEPALLLGPDEVLRPLSAEESVLLRMLREAGITPGEALARLAGLRPASAPPP